MSEGFIEAKAADGQVLAGCAFTPWHASSPQGVQTLVRSGTTFPLADVTVSGSSGASTAAELLL